RRVINANFRLGTPAAAAALAAFAANSVVPEVFRAEALAVLGEWAKPSGRDDVTGLWRPLAPRDEKMAAAALQPHLTELLRSSANPVKLAAIKSAAQLGIKAGGAVAFDLVNDTQQPSNVRVEALKALVALKEAKLPAAVKFALSDQDEGLRTEATKIQAQLKPRDAAAQLKLALEKGSITEKQTALATLGAMDNSGAADEILSQWMDKLLARQVPPELQLDLLDAAAKRNAAAIKERIRKFES